MVLENILSQDRQHVPIVLVIVMFALMVLFVPLAPLVIIKTAVIHAQYVMQANILLQEIILVLIVHQVNGLLKELKIPMNAQVIFNINISR